MLVPKWDEIDIITGQDSPDEIVDDIGQRLDSAGLNWGGNSGITISGDSSNYSRREYSDIFKVNGGHKDYYEESVNEYKGKMPTQDQVDRFFELTQNETHYLNSKPVAGQEATFNLMKIEPWDEYDLSNWNSLVRKAKAKGKSIAENNSYVRVSEPKFIKDKNNPNFLYVNFKYDTGGGVLKVFGKETMAGQIRRLSSAEAMKQATALAKDLEAKYNLEDIDVYDKENGVVQIFAVSDDFIDMDPNTLNESASTEEKRIAMRAIKSIAKYRGVSEDEAKRDLTRAIEQLGSLKEAIEDIKETIELGKNLTEELCAKGKAYRKKRMAAGEKSSAYLNGRAVKVCKGQIKG